MSLVCDSGRRSYLRSVLESGKAGQLRRKAIPEAKGVPESAVLCSLNLRVEPVFFFYYHFGAAYS